MSFHIEVQRILRKHVSRLEDNIAWMRSSNSKRRADFIADHERVRDALKDAMQRGVLNKHANRVLISEVVNIANNVMGSRRQLTHIDAYHPLGAMPSRQEYAGALKETVRVGNARLKILKAALDRT